MGYIRHLTRLQKANLEERKPIKIQAMELKLDFCNGEIKMAEKH